MSLCSSASYAVFVEGSRLESGAVALCHLHRILLYGVVPPHVV